MGSGTWTATSFVDYTTVTKGSYATVDSLGVVRTSATNQEMFKSRSLDPVLDPKGVTRECLDSEEHPNTVPVILALDCTGSMGDAAVEVAKKLNVVMTDLYSKIKDVEFMIMGIGDFSYDQCPLQVSQFESDIRIAEQLDKVYFEFGGGGNYYESYTAAWYFGVHHCKLDCWKRGKRGIIITMGDERLNPYLPERGRCTTFENCIGDDIQDNIETKDLYEEAIQKYDIYHLNVQHRGEYDQEGIKSSWGQYLDSDHFKTVTMDSIAGEIVSIVESSVNNNGSNVSVGANGISW